MKKLSLATILTLSTVSLFAAAQNGQISVSQEKSSTQITQPVQKNKDRCDYQGGRYHGDKRPRGDWNDRDEMRGGFNDPSKPAAEKASRPHRPEFNLPPMKVADASTWKDDQFIVLQGNIVEQVGKQDFLFRDASGEIEVEIDRRAWHGQEITPSDAVKLFGEVDKSWKKTEIEIRYVEKVKE
ncbi:YgiW/YdeI family stress tolerance OB fold protein [Necropsobacter massiliensis]|uniref:YgiW/YdeI family stress tolerance OB fold protein n=1 Tax=Necropsobacter massiliensis TaxID=1400001 RepID=UPI000595FD22|nr:NirD/YgiW/YdeI family stress tolerance protein [Necropsobacter massiliensis]